MGSVRRVQLIPCVRERKRLPQARAPNVKAHGSAVGFLYRVALLRHLLVYLRPHELPPVSDATPRRIPYHCRALWHRSCSPRSMGKQSADVVKPCSLCGGPIAPARLEAIPGVTRCVECAKKHPLKVDPRKLDLSEASPINRNGFAPKD
jgi:hypothetical protein